MRRPLIVTTTLGLLAIALAGAQWLTTLWPLDHGDWHERRLVYLLEVRNETGKPQRDRSLRVFVPPDIPERQRRRDIEASHSVAVEDAPGGNALARVELGDVPPYGARRVRLEVSLRVRDRVAAASAADGAAVRRGMQSRFPSDEPELRHVAARLESGRESATMRKVHDWVGGHVESIGYMAGDRGAMYALREAKGDCTEYMSLTAALALEAGLAVRAVGGFPYDRDRVAVASHFHNWVEARAGDRWWVVDAQTGELTDHMDGHIVVRRLSAPSTVGVGSQGLFMPMNGFTVRMN